MKAGCGTHPAHGGTKMKSWSPRASYRIEKTKLHKDLRLGRGDVCSKKGIFNPAHWENGTGTAHRALLARALELVEKKQKKTLERPQNREGKILLQKYQAAVKWRVWRKVTTRKKIEKHSWMENLITRGWNVAAPINAHDD
jgi:hypothetical protein